MLLNCLAPHIMHCEYCALYSPQPPPLAHSGEHRGIPRLAGRWYLSSVLWIYPGVSFCWDISGTPHPGTAQLAPFDIAEKQLYSELLPNN